MKKVLILHGWAYESKKWKPLQNELEKNGIKSEILNIPGLTEEINEVWDIDDYVKWFDKKIIDDKVILLGHSNGGRIAISYVVNHLNKVESLILIDSAGIYHNEFPIRAKRLIFGTLAKIGKQFTQSDRLRKMLYKLTREKDYFNASPNLRKTMRNLIRFDTTNLLPQIKIPTLIIWGKNDKTTPLSDGVLMSNKINNSKLIVIEGARHSPQFTNLMEVSSAIVSFVKKHDKF